MFFILTINLLIWCCLQSLFTPLFLEKEHWYLHSSLLHLSLTSSFRDIRTSCASMFLKNLDLIYTVNSHFAPYLLNSTYKVISSNKSSSNLVLEFKMHFSYVTFFWNVISLHSVSKTKFPLWAVGPSLCWEIGIPRAFLHILANWMINHMAG